MLSREHINLMFGYHRINEEQAQVNNFIRRNIEDIANRFNEKLPDNEARNLAIIKLKESLAWAVESNETNLETVTEHATIERNPVCRLCEHEVNDFIHNRAKYDYDHDFQPEDEQYDSCGNLLCDYCQEDRESLIHNLARGHAHPFVKKV